MPSEGKTLHCVLRIADARCQRYSVVFVPLWLATRWLADAENLFLDLRRIRRSFLLDFAQHRFNPHTVIQ